MPNTVSSWVGRLLYNLRFYILAFSVITSLGVLGFLRLEILSDQLFYIRSQQIFGLLAVLMIYIAIILTPLSKLLRKNTILPHFLFARRAIGVSAAYFAFLHINIALIRQVGGFEAVILLPDRFKVAFALGSVAYLILFLMAITSFDKAMEVMSFKRWKQLHRFIYLAGVLIILHVWMIGTHIVQRPYIILALILLAVLFGLESLRVSNNISNRYLLTKPETIVLSLAIFAISMTALISMPQFVRNYHSSHHSDHESSRPND